MNSGRKFGESRDRNPELWKGSQYLTLEPIVLLW
jgi:hypothetical protein